MKTKKLLSVVLALTVVVSMFATLTVTASAGQAKTVLSVVKSTVYSIENGTLVATRDFSAASGSVNNITMRSMWEEYLRIDDLRIKPFLYLIIIVDLIEISTLSENTPETSS